MHNSRSLLGGIKFHLSGSVEARANLCRAAPSGVTHVCIVRAWGISDNAGQRRLLGVMVKLILYAYMPTCLHTNMRQGKVSMFLTYVLSLGHIRHIFPRLVVVGLCGDWGISVITGHQWQFGVFLGYIY